MAKMAASKSSNITPKPPLSFASHWRIGAGFQISNSRKSAKATAHQSGLAGVNLSTSIMATISSHTILPWSDTPKALPTWVQSGIPIKNKAAIVMKCVDSGVNVSSQNRGRPTIVPTVPGAFGDSPVPKPKAIKWLG